MNRVRIGLGLILSFGLIVSLYQNCGKPHEAVVVDPTSENLTLIEASSTLAVANGNDGTSFEQVAPCSIPTIDGTTKSCYGLVQFRGVGSSKNVLLKLGQATVCYEDVGDSNKIYKKFINFNVPASSSKTILRLYETNEGLSSDGAGNCGQRERENFFSADLDLASFPIVQFAPESLSFQGTVSARGQIGFSRAFDSAISSTISAKCTSPAYNFTLKISDVVNGAFNGSAIGPTTCQTLKVGVLTVWPGFVVQTDLENVLETRQIASWSSNTIALGPGQCFRNGVISNCSAPPTTSPPSTSPPSTNPGPNPTYPPPTTPSQSCETVCNQTANGQVCTSRCLPIIYPSISCSKSVYECGDQVACTARGNNSQLVGCDTSSPSTCGNLNGRSGWSYFSELNFMNNIYTFRWTNVNSNTEDSVNNWYVTDSFGRSQPINVIVKACNPPGGTPTSCEAGCVGGINYSICSPGSANCSCNNGCCRRVTSIVQQCEVQ